MTMKGLKERLHKAFWFVAENIDKQEQITCRLSIYPHRVRAGERINAVASSPKRGFFTPHIFYFSADGGLVVRTNASDSCVVDTRGLTPGTYRLRAYVYQGADPWHQADADAIFEVTA
jgi:hypothetical protein